MAKTLSAVTVVFWRTINWTKTTAAAISGRIPTGYLGVRVIVEGSQYGNSRCLVINWTGALSLVSFNLLYLLKQRSSSVMSNIICTVARVV